MYVFALIGQAMRTPLAATYMWIFLFVSYVCRSIKLTLSTLLKWSRPIEANKTYALCLTQMKSLDLSTCTCISLPSVFNHSCKRKRDWEMKKFTGCFHWSLRSGSGTIRVDLQLDPAKTRETYCANAYISDYPHYWSKFPLMVSIIWKQLDCREVARDTQSALSCLCTYSTYDIRYSGKFPRFSRAEQLTHK